MSTPTGPNYSVDNQMTFIVQWFRTWSELQKDDFVEILAERLAAKGNVNGLVNGVKKMDIENKRVSLFACQMKLFNEWWQTWSDQEKEAMTAKLKDSDPKFWTAVEEELNGTRKKVEDDFFMTINSNCIANATENGARITTEEQTIPGEDPPEESEMNGDGGEVAGEVVDDEISPVTENGVDAEPEENGGDEGASG